MNPTRPRRRRRMLAAATTALVTTVTMFAPWPSPAGASTFTDACFVRDAYTVFLDRAANGAEVDRWAIAIATGRHRSDLPEALASSDEWLGVEVDKLYLQALDRRPDAAGRAYWSDQLRRGAKVNRIGSQIYGSQEFYNRAGGTDTKFVESLYTRILGRSGASDRAGREFWVAQVPVRGRGEVAGEFFASIESRRGRVTALYERILERGPDAGGLSFWAGQLRRTNDVALAVELASSMEFYNGAQVGCATYSAPYRDSSNGTGQGGLPRGWFKGGEKWWGDFGDPHVVTYNGVHYAYSSPTGGRVLPVLTSTDTETWTAHRNWSSGGPPGTRGYSLAGDTAIPWEIRNLPWSEWDRYYNNDALVRGPSWGTFDGSNWLGRTIWAPGVARIGSTWYAYYAVRVQHGVPGFPYGRFCLSVASATSPIGPFRDISGSGPILCDSYSEHPGGSIDPYPFVDPATGQAHLMWKASGKPGVRPSAIRSIALGSNGRPTGSAATLLTTNEGGWEGYTIENPSMIRTGGRYYLFYSGNLSDARDSDGFSRYATGYAICTSARGGCSRKTVSTPLMGNTYREWGPGGASPFVGPGGKVMLAYAFFWPGERRGEFPAGQGRHPRRINAAEVTVGGGGLLSVSRRQWVPG